MVVDIGSVARVDVVHSIILDSVAVLETTEVGLVLAGILFLVLGTIVLRNYVDSTVASESDERSTGKQREQRPTEETDTRDANERVLTLLEKEGGRIRQRRIVDATGWSKTKVSRTLSSMEAEGDIVKIQLGRENLICLPDQTPMQPPLDER